MELRSDTFTRPSASMRQAMANAEVGDDVWNEDPTVRRLEERAAELMGKDAAVFVTSGTQGNLVALLSHTQRGDEIILGDQSHIFNYEVAGAAVVGGLQVRALLNGADGRLDPAAIAGSIRGDDVHEPRTGCIALENTHNRCGGAVLPVEYLELTGDIAHARGVPLHLDGARIFNAAIALGVPAATVARSADSVTFCLSKGLGAPVGSLLCGSSEFVGRARKWRKMLGGGMRQVGILAAAGLYALDSNIEQLAEDHANARLLAEGLAQIPGVGIDLDSVQSNMVFFDVAGLGISRSEFLRRLTGLGVRMAGARDKVRAVLSLEVTRDDVTFAVDAVARIAGEAMNDSETAPALARTHAGG